MSMFYPSYDHSQEASTRRHSEVERWVRQRSLVRSAREATDHGEPASARGQAMAPVTALVRRITTAAMPRVRVRHSPPVHQPHH